MVFNHEEDIGSAVKRHKKLTTLYNSGFNPCIWSLCILKDS